jgi:hypothetical protein
VHHLLSSLPTPPTKTDYKALCVLRCGRKMRGLMSGLGIQMQGTVTVEQFLHRHGVIHAGAVPWENAGPGIDIQTVLAAPCTR